MAIESMENSPEITEEQLRLALDAGAELLKIKALLGSMYDIHPGTPDGDSSNVRIETYQDSKLFAALQVRRAELLGMLRDFG